MSYKTLVVAYTIKLYARQIDRLGAAAFCCFFNRFLSPPSAYGTLSSVAGSRKLLSPRRCRRDKTRYPIKEHGRTRYNVSQAKRVYYYNLCLEADERPRGKEKHFWTRSRHPQSFRARAHPKFRVARNKCELKVLLPFLFRRRFFFYFPPSVAATTFLFAGARFSAQTSQHRAHSCHMILLNRSRRLRYIIFYVRYARRFFCRPKKWPKSCSRTVSSAPPTSGARSINPRN